MSRVDQDQVQPGPRVHRQSTQVPTGVRGDLAFDTGKAPNSAEKAKHARRGSNPQPMVSKTISSDDLKTQEPDATPQLKWCDDDRDRIVLASCLALLAEKSPDLAIVVGKWD